MPTLAEVIDFARGKFRINVELKYNVPDVQLAAAVVALLREKRFLDQVVITSLDHAALRQVEQLQPSLDTGLIVTAAVGNVVGTDTDFVSLNSARASTSFIDQARVAGKQVHVWTVNKPDVMLRMIERNVDNIITDDPATSGSRHARSPRAHAAGAGGPAPARAVHRVAARTGGRELGSLAMSPRLPRPGRR